MSKDGAKMGILTWPIVIVPLVIIAAGFLLGARSTGIARVLILIVAVALAAIPFIWTGLPFFSVSSAADTIEFFEFTIIVPLSVFIIANSLIRRSKNKILHIFIIICAAMFLLVHFTTMIIINAIMGI